MKAITNREESFSVNNCNVVRRLHKGTYTRETATQLAIATLFLREEIPTIDKIDDLCFISWGFPVSHRKYSPLKSKGGLTVKKRIERYTYNNEMMNYDIDSERFMINGKIADTITAIRKKRERKQFLFALHEKRALNSTKNVSVSKFKNKISSMFYLHLIQSGKLAY